MEKTLWTRVFNSDSDNRKSKIENRKWVGIFAIVVTFVVCWGCGYGAAAEESSPDRVSIVVRSSY